MVALCVLAAAWAASGTGARADDLGAGTSCEPEPSADLAAVTCTLDTGEGISSVSLETLRQLAGASTSVPVWVQAWGGGGERGYDKDAIGTAGSGGKQGYAQVYFESFRALTEAVGEDLHYYVGEGGAAAGSGDLGAGGSSTIVSTKSLGEGVACIYAVRNNSLTTIADGTACQKASQSNIVLLAGGGGGGGGTFGANDGGNGGSGGSAVSGSEPVFGAGANGQSHSGRRGLGGTKGQGGGTEGDNGPKDGGDLIGGAGGYPQGYTGVDQPGYVNATPYGSTIFGFGGNGGVDWGYWRTIEYTGDGGSGGGGLGGGGSSGYGTAPWGPGGGGGGGGSFAMAGDEPPPTGPNSSVAAASNGQVSVTFGYSADCSTSSDSSSTGIRATCVLPAEYSSVDVDFLAHAVGASTSSDIWLQAWGGYGGDALASEGAGGKGGYALTQFQDVAAMKTRLGTAIVHDYLGAAGSIVYSGEAGGEGQGGASTAVTLEGLSEENPPCIVAGETIISDGGQCAEEADSNMILVAGGGGGGSGQPLLPTHANGGAGGVALAGNAAAFAAGRPGGSTTGAEPGQGGQAPATGGIGGKGGGHTGNNGGSAIGGEGGGGTGYQAKTPPLADTFGYGGTTWAGGGGGMGGGGAGVSFREGSAYVFGAAGGGGSFAAAGEENRNEPAPSEKQPGEDGAFAVSVDGVSQKISAVGTPLSVAAARNQTIDGLSVRIRCPRLCVVRTSGKVIGRRAGSRRHRFAFRLVRDATTVLSGRRGEVQLQVAGERKLRRLLRHGARRPSTRIRVRAYDREGKKLGGRLVSVKRVRLHRVKHGHRRHHAKHTHRR